jgi:hypothetical protein
MTEENFYDLWTKFANSDLIESLPDDLEEFCKKHQITIDYFLQEWL